MLTCGYFICGSKDPGPDLTCSATSGTHPDLRRSWYRRVHVDAPWRMADVPRMSPRLPPSP
jgi:hypothetical protein